MCGDAEVEHLHVAVRNHDVSRLQVAVDDAMGVSGGERIGDLRTVTHRRSDRQWAGFHHLPQRLALDELHHQVVGTDVEDGADVGMAEGRECASFTLESPGQRFRDDFDGDQPIEPRVSSGVDLAHSALANFGKDLIRAESLPDHGDAILSPIPEHLRHDTESLTVPRCVGFLQASRMAWGTSWPCRGLRRIADSSDQVRTDLDDICIVRGYSCDVLVGERQWPDRRFRRELFYLDATNTLMAVPIETSASRFTAAKPYKVFDSKYWGAFYSYDVPPDGQRSDVAPGWQVNRDRALR